MKLAAPFALAGCFALRSCTSRPAVDRDGRAANVALGRRVFTEIYGGGKVSLVDELTLTISWTTRRAVVRDAI
jgi:hypothetical protein